MKYFKLNLLLVIILLNAEIITPQSVVNNVSSGNVGERFLMNVNCFKLPIDNSGIIADVEVDTFSGGKLNEDPVLFSAGFGLTGKLDNSIWASITFASKRISDFLPGTVEDTSSQSKDIYIVRDSDPAFSSSWQQWKTPVRFGALFYDGDNDGTYNPIDKNSNGLWDSNEDMPFILGKTIAWCVFNDSRTSLYRGYSSTFPMSIEVQQYVFADDATHLQNTVFIIYSITNKGLITENLDSVYFSLLVDSDIGEYYDDLSGCDTLLNSGFTYNHEV